MASDQNSDGSYKLLEEDYENIWLRIKDKTRKQVYLVYGAMAAVIALVGFIFISNLYTHSKELISRSIKEYVKGESFKQQMNETFRDQFKVVDDKLKLINDGLSKLDIYKSAPLSITDHGFTLVDHKGNYVIVEYGTGKTKFKSQFREPPVVFISDMGVAFESPVRREEYKPLVKGVTKEGFSLGGIGASIYIKPIHWIAIGK